MHKKNSHCSFCGHPFLKTKPWPRDCANCGNTSYLNPLPVSVVLVPVDNGLLFIRRRIEPGKGKLALPGGFINLGETWQEAGAREVYEETGIRIKPSEIREFWVRSASDGTILIFGSALVVRSTHLPRFEPTDETAERLVLTEPPEEMAFELHKEAIEHYFK